MGVQYDIHEAIFQQRDKGTEDGVALQTQAAVSRILQAPRTIVHQPGRYPVAE